LNGEVITHDEVSGEVGVIEATAPVTHQIVKGLIGIITLGRATKIPFVILRVKEISKTFIARIQNKAFRTKSQNKETEAKAKSNL
jgi:hypothetical protein